VGSAHTRQAVGWLCVGAKRRANQKARSEAAAKPPMHKQSTDQRGPKNEVFSLVIMLAMYPKKIHNKHIKAGRVAKAKTGVNR